MSKKTSIKTNSLPSLRLNPTTSLRALASKAIRASAIAIATEKVAPPKSAPRKKPRRASKTKVATEIESLKCAIELKLNEFMMLVCENPHKFSSAVADFKVYKKEDIDKAAKEKEAWEALGRPAGFKVKQAVPMIRYVVYPAISDRNSIGSIAIYCANVVDKARMIRRLGHIFGFRVSKVNVEVGLSPYVDVYLRG